MERLQKIGAPAETLVRLRDEIAQAARDVEPARVPVSLVHGDCKLRHVWATPDGIQVLSAGALRGLKDTRVPMFLAALAYWGIGMPLGAGLGLWLGWGPRGMWIGLIAGLTVAAVLLCRRFLRSSALAAGRHAPI